MIRGLSALALAFTLTACGGGGDEPTAKSTPSPSPSTTSSTPEPMEDSPSPSPDEVATAMNEPNTGANALRIGQARKGAAFTTQVVRVRLPYPPGEFNQPEPGMKFFGIFLRQCRADNATSRDLTDDEAMTTYNGDWSLRDQQGNTYAGNGSSWSDWPQPKFPETRVLAIDDCRRGWMLVEIPENVRPTLLEWGMSGSPIAEWVLNPS